VSRFLGWVIQVESGGRSVLRGSKWECAKGVKFPVFDQYFECLGLDGVRTFQKAWTWCILANWSVRYPGIEYQARKIGPKLPQMGNPSMEKVPFFDHPETTFRHWISRSFQYRAIQCLSEGTYVWIIKSRGSISGEQITWLSYSSRKWWSVGFEGVKMRVRQGSQISSFWSIFRVFMLGWCSYVPESLNMMYSC
jgi:hypothetical protein